MLRPAVAAPPIQRLGSCRTARLPSARAHTRWLHGATAAVWSARTDHYRVLGLRRDSSQQDIKSAWLRKVKTHHPDTAAAADSGEGEGGRGGRGGRSGGGTTASFIDITRAFETLNDERRRYEYDLSLGGRTVNKPASVAQEAPRPQAEVGRLQRPGD
jgi:curved DNA-binding protein CbpA|eukprot:COSAG01_NODE_2057_length_8526_cov_21.248576_2_plen_158_part_00